MKIDAEILKAPSKACGSCGTTLQRLETYPTSIVEVLIFHRLHFHMCPELALKAFQQLQSEFVDWNEVRVSPIREIQEQVSKAEDSLELSVFIKDLLEFVHKERHTVDLEHLVAENLTDIRRYLKQVRNIDPASIDLVLMLRKGHPLVPLTAPMEQMFLELGLIGADDSRDRRAKSLFELILANSDRPAPARTAAVPRAAATPNGNGAASENGTVKEGVIELAATVIAAPPIEELYEAAGGIYAFDTALAFHHIALNHCRSEEEVKKGAFTAAGCVLGEIASRHAVRPKRASRARKSSGGRQKAPAKTVKKTTKRRR